MNHYKSYNDPYINHVLTELKSIDLFAIALARQQFPLQRKPDLAGLGRCLLLFVDGNPLKATEGLFLANYGFSMHDWVFLCVATYSLVMKRRPPVFHLNNFLDSTMSSLPMVAVEPFLKLASLAPVELASYYKDIRARIPPYLHIFISSSFFDHPMIAYDDKTFLVVHPYLMVHYALDGLYRLCDKVGTTVFHSNLARSFARYVERLALVISSPDHVFSENHIQKVSPGRACDYVIDLPDCLLLIECKATRYSAVLATDNAIANDNSTGKIAEAFEQIKETAKRIRKGELQRLFPEDGKPIYGLVATFGELPFVNAPSYFETYIARRMSVGTSDPLPWYEPLAQPPQVFSVELLEEFIIVLKDQSQTPSQLIEDKIAKDTVNASDWGPYMQSAFSVINREIPFLRETVDRFFGGTV